MTPNEYQQAAMRTAGPALSDADGLLVTALGLCGEAGELAYIYTSHNSVDNELGDVYWYVARGATALRTDLETLRQHVQYQRVYNNPPGGSLANAVIHLFGACGTYADYTKKALYHTHQFEQSTGIELLATAFARLDYLTNALGSNAEVVMFKNVEKLKARYPEGFSGEASRNRPEYLRAVEQLD